MDNLKSRDGSFNDTIGQVLLLCIAEILGENHLDRALDQNLISRLTETDTTAIADRAFSFSTLSEVQLELEHAFGHRGGQGLALRSGRNFFNHALRLYGGSLGLASNDFLLKSLPQKTGIALKAVAKLFNQVTGHQAIIEESETSFLWRIKHCPFCWGREEKEPICHFTIGLLQETLYWASGGKIYHVEETTCLACGDPECLIVISRVPMM